MFVALTWVVRGRSTPPAASTCTRVQGAVVLYLNFA
jgi:hypothetical protein